jgi:hypothetical protein
MGMKVSKELEAQILAAARPRESVAQSSPIITAPPEIYTSEAAFQAAIIKQARCWGWEDIYHTYDSRRSEPGFPDLIMLRRDRMLVWELKRSAREKPTPKQRKWLKAFQLIPSAEVRVYSPEDWTFIIKDLS